MLAGLGPERASRVSGRIARRRSSGRGGGCSMQRSSIRSEGVGGMLCIDEDGILYVHRLFDTCFRMGYAGKMPIDARGKRKLAAIR